LPLTLSIRIKQLAHDAGFDLCGIAPVGDFGELQAFPEWIADGKHGEMKYMESRDDAGDLKRAALARVAPWAKSVIVCAINYNTAHPYSTQAQKSTPSQPGEASRGWISRYAWAQEDYHDSVLQRLQRAAGLPKIDDPDAAVLPRADALAAARARVFLDLGLDVEDTLDVVKVLTVGLRRAAAMLRQPAFGAIARSGTSELQFAKVAEELAGVASPLLGPFVEGLLLLQLRHLFEEERISATERAAGKLPGARHVAVAFADLGSIATFNDQRGVFLSLQAGF